jgi:PRC-barrel domain protein
MEPGTGTANWNGNWNRQMEAGMNAKSLVTTAFAAALSAGLALSAAAEDTPGSAPGESTNHASTGTAEPPSVTVLNTHEVEGILGRPVLGADDQNMGRIVDVIVDRSGRVRAAVIDFGGFLGVGSRKIAVDWSALHFPPPGQPNAKISLDLTRDLVKAAPEYQEGKPIVVLGALGKLEPLPFE